jgi:hypothetical protein
MSNYTLNIISNALCQLRDEKKLTQEDVKELTANLYNRMHKEDKIKEERVE